MPDLDAAGGRRPVLEGRVDAHHLAGDAAQQDRGVSAPTTTRCHCHFLVGRANAADPGQLRRLGAPAHSEQGGPGHLVVADHQPRARRGRRVRTSSRISSSTRGLNRSRRRSPTPDQERHLSRDHLDRCAPTRRSTARAARVSYVTGSHAIKAGYTLMMGDYEQTVDAASATCRSRAVNGVPNVGDLRRHADARHQPRPAESRDLRPGSVDDRSPHGERRPAPRLLPQRLPGPERAAHPVRAGRAVRSRPGSGQLEGSEPAVSVWPTTCSATARRRSRRA